MTVMTVMTLMAVCDLQLTDFDLPATSIDDLAPDSDASYHTDSEPDEIFMTHSKNIHS